MIVEELELHNLRNYEFLKVSFKPGINYIYGENASGKTNILEAIYFLSLGFWRKSKMKIQQKL